MNSQVLLTGNLSIVERDTSGAVVRMHRAQNVVTSGGLSYLRDFLAGLSPAPPIYVVYGSGTAPVGRFLTAVPGETFRAPIVYSDTTGFSAIYHWWLSISDNQNQTVGSYGLVGGDATAGAGTGTLIAIANEPDPFGKNASNTYSGDWVLTLSGLVS